MSVLDARPRPVLAREVDAEAVIEAAAQAIDTGELVHLGDLRIVPDVLLLECLANATPLGPTLRAGFDEDDPDRPGRMAHIYRVRS